MLGRGHIEEGHGVVVGGAGLGVVGDQAMAGGAVQAHGLVSEGEVADVGVVEGFLAVGGAAPDLVAVPKAGEIGAFEQEFADEKINEAYERVLASDVRYRFVIDVSTLG
ncbi:MAG: hypothetical protein JWN52_3966 [Actinomycetia bacterium]|nr:hypothetical protein [Actinomycetes bacterium]